MFRINNWRDAIKPGTIVGDNDTKALRTDFKTFLRALLGVVFQAFETKFDLYLSQNLKGLVTSRSLADRWIQKTSP